MDPVGNGRDQLAQELRRLHLACALHKASEGELARAVDGHEQPQLAFLCPHLGEVDMKVADGISLEALPLKLVAPSLGQAADAVPLEQRDTYGKAFLQVLNRWTESDKVKEFVFGKRLARIAAELMRVSGVRIYHDQALYKEPGGGITPWHADQYYWPVSSDRTITAWVPLQNTPCEMGPLAFCEKSHRFQIGRDLEISDKSEMKLKQALKTFHTEDRRRRCPPGNWLRFTGWTRR